MSCDNHIWCIGATGKTGRRVVERLVVPQGRRCESAPARRCRRSTGRIPPHGRLRCADVDAVYISLLPRPRRARGARCDPRVHRACGRERCPPRVCCCRDAASRRPALRSRSSRHSGARMDGAFAASWFAQNFSENFLLDADPRRRGRAAGAERRRAVRGCRRHRRRRRRCVHRLAPRRAALRADRSAALDLCRRRGGHRPRDRPIASIRANYARRVCRRRFATRRSRRIAWRCSDTCSPRCWMAATHRSPTA